MYRELSTTKLRQHKWESFVNLCNFVQVITQIITNKAYFYHLATKGVENAVAVRNLAYLYIFYH